jgi:sodium-dependent dicarboxylate transporter 2/3/5
MLPIATGPNAIVFGTGRVRQGDMVRKGLILNVLCSVALVLLLLLWS